MPDTRIAAIDAKPEPVRVPLGTCAVLVVDMQNDFGARGGMFHRAGIDISPIERIVEPIARVIAAARSAGLPIVHLKMEHAADLGNMGGAGSPHAIKHGPLGVGQEVTAPDGRASRILVAGNWNTDIVPRLAPRDGDVVVSKHRYSGFFQTELDRVLKERDITHLVVTGATTSVCVESTVRDAMYRDYHCVVLEDCTAEPIAHDSPRSNHEASLLTMQILFAWISDSERFMAAL